MWKEIVYTMAIISSIPAASQAQLQSQQPKRTNYCKLLSENKQSHERIYKEIIIAPLSKGSSEEGFTENGLDEKGFKNYYPYQINVIEPFKKLWKSIENTLQKKDNNACKEKNEEIWDFMRTKEFRKLAKWGKVEDLVDWKLMIITPRE